MTKSAHESRLIPLQGVHNFRDFGGWRAQNGQNVQRQRLYRSGHLSRSTAADQNTIAALGLDTLADLRQPIERAREPNVLPTGAEPKIIEATDGGYDEPPHLQFLRENDLTAPAVRRYMISAYQRIPTEAHHQKAFAAVFRALGRGETVLIHCAAGKDRTGILAALILSALGVSRDDIYEDYLLTNAAVDIDALLPSLTTRINALAGQDVGPAVLRPMLGVEADYLDAAFAVIGPVATYFETVLGLDDADIKALRSTLLCA